MDRGNRSDRLRISHSVPDYLSVDTSHFWALSLNRADEYAHANVPMLPVVAGEAATTRQILFYSALLVPVSLLPWALGFAGIIYGVVAAISGALFVVFAWQLRKASDTDRQAAHRLFAFSIVYLFVLFAALLGKRANRGPASFSARVAPTDVTSMQAGSCTRDLSGSRAEPPFSAQTRSDMRHAVLAIVMIGAATLGGCSEGVLDPKGPDCRRRTANSIQLAWHHAGDRDPDDPRHAWRRLVVPRVEQARPLPARTLSIPTGSRCWSGRSLP